MGFPKKKETGAEPEPAQQSQRQSQMWSPYDDGPRTRGPFWFIVGGVVVLAALVVALMVMFNADPPAPAATEARPTSDPLPTAPPGKYGFADQRKTDPDPLTVKELFPSAKVVVDGRQYTMTITRKDKKCADAVVGEKLQKALKDGKCTQVIRASFRDAKGEIIGTVGVANLLDTKAADKASKAGGKGERQDYVKPLPGKDKVTKFLGSGEAGAQVWTHGHYAVMIWFQFKDGHKPDKKEGKRLFQAADDITQNTVFKALDGRSLSGAAGG
ncbi:hypothetical protein [Thermoactinospora rubra]|uniref:hypothetical protein n=1 Tax=Thermoactinospora rubra TaxID=1088767 RepID=UPI000A111CC4|nr:hypothetical protein [Thermoactinospora rubra]